MILRIDGLCPRLLLLLLLLQVVVAIEDEDVGEKSLQSSRRILLKALAKRMAAQSDADGTKGGNLLEEKSSDEISRFPRFTRTQGEYDSSEDTEGEKEEEEEGEMREQGKRSSKGEPTLWVVPPDPMNFAAWRARKDESTSVDRHSSQPQKRQSGAPVLASDAQISHGDAFRDFDQFTDARGVAHRPRSRSPFTKPGLWEPNPDNPHNRDHANKFWYHPESTGVDWLNGQLQWGAHWAVPAAGTGGTDGMSTLHFPSIGNFFNIPDDYD